MNNNNNNFNWLIKIAIIDLLFVQNGYYQVLFGLIVFSNTLCYSVINNENVITDCRLNNLVFVFALYYFCIIHSNIKLYNNLTAKVIRESGIWSTSFSLCTLFYS